MVIRVDIQELDPQTLQFACDDVIEVLSKYNIHMKIGALYMCLDSLPVKFHVIERPKNR